MCSYDAGMDADDEHGPICRQYEARCRCGSRWRVYRPLTEDDDDPMATCISCGEDTFDLTDAGEVRA
jgi:hypothetical protein